GARAPSATPIASSSHWACISTATSSPSYSSRSRAPKAAHSASSTTDTVQLRLRSREVDSPRSPLVESATLEVRWWTCPAMVVRPGPPSRDAAAALNPPMVANTPVPADVSVKYVHGPGGPSKASRSILVSRLTVTAGGVPLMLPLQGCWDCGGSRQKRGSPSGASFGRGPEPGRAADAARIAVRGADDAGGDGIGARARPEEVAWQDGVHRLRQSGDVRHPAAQHHDIGVEHVDQRREGAGEPGMVAGQRRRRV